MGLISKLLPADQVLAHAQAQAAKLVALPAESIRQTKRLMKAGREALKAHIDVESAQFGAMLTGAEAKEAFTAFFEKRKPDFTKFA
jgi:1,4-dihydroxy-2-naphthoyl-CoA synthase